MTVLVAGIGLVLCLLLGGLKAAAAHASSLQARAEIAADAAALAAAAESGPFGGGDPRGVAGDYTRMNGARLVACSCPRGATSVKVTVAVGAARASARAVFDAAAMAPAGAEGTGGLDPLLAGAVTRLLAASRGRVTLVSGYRSVAEQRVLWRRALARYGSPEAADDWVARPGASMHNKGLAVDLGGDLALAVSLIRTLHLPLYRPLPNEHWHFELRGSRGGAATTP